MALSKVKQWMSLSSSAKYDISAKSEKMNTEENAFSDHVRFVTWNLDGLDEQNDIRIRTEAVCKLLAELKPDIIHLQEVVAASEEIIKQSLAGYKYLSSPKDRYYNATLLREATVSLRSFSPVEFKEKSLMCRNILKTKVKIGDIKVTTLNSHLESNPGRCAIRTQQLVEAFAHITGEKSNENVIFAGDLNLFDSELESIGGLPQDVIDVWEATGKQSESEFTWDMLNNDNRDCKRFKSQQEDETPPRRRLDRIYFRASNPAKLRPDEFHLFGTQRIESQKCFPSDHWGLIVDFKKIINV